MIMVVTNGFKLLNYTRIYVTIKNTNMVAFADSEGDGRNAGSKR